MVQRDINKRAVGRGDENPLLMEHKLLFGLRGCFKMILLEPCGVSFLEEKRSDGEDKYLILSHFSLVLHVLGRENETLILALFRLSAATTLLLVYEE